MTEKMSLGTIGVLGVGHVGSHYVTHLTTAGASVHAYDKDPARCEAARLARADIAGSARELAGWR